MCIIFAPAAKWAKACELFGPIIRSCPDTCSLWQRSHGRNGNAYTGGGFAANIYANSVA